MSKHIEILKRDIKRTIDIYLQRTGQEGYFDDSIGEYIEKEKKDKTSQDEKDVLLNDLNEDLNHLLNSELANSEYLMSLSDYKKYCFESIEKQQIKKDFTNSDLYNSLKEKLKRVQNDQQIKFEWYNVNVSNFLNNNSTYKKRKEGKISFLKEKLSQLEKDDDLNYFDKYGLLHSYNLSERIINNLMYICHKYRIEMEYEAKSFFSKSENTDSDDSFSEFIIRSMKQDIVELFVRLQKASIDDDHFFINSPYKVYENHYEERLDDFKEKNVDADEVDFLKKEVERVNEERTLHINNSSFTLPEIIELDEKIDISKKKKLQFLEDKLSELGYNLQITSNEDSGYAYFIEILKAPDQDSTNNKQPQLTANQAVILLSRAGFFEQSPIEDLTLNKQSKIVSKLIGKDRKNISDYIRKLDSTSPSDNYKKDMEKIDDLLES